MSRRPQGGLRKEVWKSQCAGVQVVCEHVSGEHASVCLVCALVCAQGCVSMLVHRVVGGGCSYVLGLCMCGCTFGPAQGCVGPSMPRTLGRNVVGGVRHLSVLGMPWP